MSMDMEPDPTAEELLERDRLRAAKRRRAFRAVTAITLLSITAGMEAYFAPLPSASTQARARSRLVVPPPLAAPTALIEPVEATPPEFPRLKVAGIMLDGLNSSALINGRTIRLGEWIEGVQLVDVREDYIEVQLKGIRRRIPRANLAGHESASAPASNSAGMRH